MNRKILGWFLLVFFSCGIAHAQDILFTVQAPLQEVSPVADGTISDGEYSYELFLSFVDRENPGYPWPNLDHMCPDNCDLDTDSPDAMGDDDLSATMHLAHTDEYLFLGFDVTDGYIECSGIGAADAFKNDAVELYIDADADGADGHGSTTGIFENMQLVADPCDGLGEPAFDPDDIEFNNRYSDHAEPIAVFEPDPAAGEFYTAGFAHSDTNYVIEWQIPLESLDVEDGDGFTAASTGDTLRFQAVIDDNDYEGSQGQDTYAELWYIEGDTQSAWGGAETNWVVGLELSEAVTTDPGDIDGDGDSDADDIDAVSAGIKAGDANFDINEDGAVDNNDFGAFVTDVMQTWIGDSNLDLEFNSGDLVAVFGVGKYESEQMAGWAEGDWNGDMTFDSSDLVAAFTDGGYELGPFEPGAPAVPEPSALSLLAVGLLAALGRRLWKR